MFRAATWPEAPSFAVSALRRADPFGRILCGAVASGVDPEVFVAEYGRDQFETTTAGLSMALPLQTAPWSFGE